MTTRIAMAGAAMAAAAMSLAGFGVGAPPSNPRRDRLYAKARSKPKVAHYRQSRWRRNKHTRPEWGRKLNGVI